MLRNKNLIPLILLWISYLIPAESTGQTPLDELMMPKQDLCILVNYEFGKFDQYWEGEELRKNGTIATVQRRTGLVMAAYGITDKLDMYLGLPFVQTNSTIPNGGKFAGTSGLQDLSTGFKYKILDKKTEKHQLSLLASTMFSFPVSNYLSDYQPYSLGLKTPQLAWRILGHYQLPNGLYGRAVAGYVWKGYTKAEREYYYNNGSYFTPWMDVPNSINFDLTVGKWFLQNSLRVEATLSTQNSVSGDDIRAYNAPQPTNKVDFMRLGGFAHYYFPKINGLGVLGYWNQVIDGRNMPEISTWGLGVTYQFGLKKLNQ